MMDGEFVDEAAPWTGYSPHVEAHDLAARWHRLLAAVQLHWLEHNGSGNRRRPCQLCSLYEGDWWA
jgi:hypothetical protein